MTTKTMNGSLYVNTSFFMSKGLLPKLKGRGCFRKLHLYINSHDSNFSAVCAACVAVVVNAGVVGVFSVIVRL